MKRTDLKIVRFAFLEVETSVLEKFLKSKNSIEKIHKESKANISLEDFVSELQHQIKMRKDYPLTPIIKLRSTEEFLIALRIIVQIYKKFND